MMAFEESYKLAKEISKFLKDIDEDELTVDEKLKQVMINFPDYDFYLRNEGGLLFLRIFGNDVFSLVLSNEKLIF